MGKTYGIEAAVLDALAEREATRGGILVAQVETVSGRVFRARDGWVLEMCGGEDCLHIRLIGSTVARTAELDLFTWIGDERETLAEVEAARLADEAAENARRAAAADAEFDHLFDSILPEYLDAPEIVLAAE